MLTYANIESYIRMYNRTKTAEQAFYNRTKTAEQALYNRYYHELITQK